MTKTTKFADLPNFNDTEKAEITHKEFDGGSSLAPTSTNASRAEYDETDEGRAVATEHKKAVRWLLFKLGTSVVYARDLFG